MAFESGWINHSFCLILYWKFSRKEYPSLGIGISGGNNLIPYCLSCPQAVKRDRVRVLSSVYHLIFTVDGVKSVCRKVQKDIVSRKSLFKRSPIFTLVNGIITQRLIRLSVLAILFLLLVFVLSPNLISPVSLIHARCCVDLVKNMRKEKKRAHNRLSIDPKEIVIWYSSWECSRKRSEESFSHFNFIIFSCSGNLG